MTDESLEAKLKNAILSENKPNAQELYAKIDELKKQVEQLNQKTTRKETTQEYNSNGYAIPNKTSDSQKEDLRIKQLSDEINELKKIVAELNKEKANKRVYETKSVEWCLFKKFEENDIFRDFGKRKFDADAQIMKEVNFGIYRALRFEVGLSVFEKQKRQNNEGISYQFYEYISAKNSYGVEKTTEIRIHGSQIIYCILTPGDYFIELIRKTKKDQWLSFKPLIEESSHVEFSANVSVSINQEKITKVKAYNRFFS